jgi:hypothetical protein
MEVLEPKVPEHLLLHGYELLKLVIARLDPDVHPWLAASHESRTGVSATLFAYRKLSTQELASESAIAF